MYRYYLAFESRGRIYDGEGYSIIEERDIYIFIERLATLLKGISEKLGQYRISSGQVITKLREEIYLTIDLPACQFIYPQLENLHGKLSNRNTIY